MKNLTILIVLIFFAGIGYWGIEPYAHSIMHPEVDEADYTFSDLNSSFSPMSIKEGNITAGKEQFMANCNVCHSLEADGLSMMSNEDLISSNGLLPPDLSNITSVIDENFLLAFIKDPIKSAFTSTFENHKKEELAQQKANITSQEESQALLTAHTKAIDSFSAKQAQSFIKMPAFDWLGDAEIGNIIAYLKSIAKPLDELTGKNIMDLTCARCHSMNYDNVKILADAQTLPSYLGSMPPDLSQMIKSKGKDYLHKFINDPQKLLANTGMPRLGLNEKAQEKLVAYIEKIGDPNIEARNTIGKWAIIFFIILSVFAYAWKHNEFERVGK